MGAVAKKKTEVVSPASRERIYRRAIKELERRARRSLYSFVRQGWATVEKGTAPEWNWHVEAFCFHIQSMLEGWLVANRKGTPEMLARQIAAWESHGLEYQQGELLVQNLIVNLPPVTLKSKVLMVFAPAWMWLHCPHWEMWAISSVEKNVKRDSNACKDLIKSPWYRDTFKIQWSVRSDMDSVEEWVTTAGGKRTSSTLLGGATGLHYDAILLDDPDDAHRVFSAAKREEVQDKWTRSIKNRVKQMNRTIRIAIQQRVHVDDWTAAQVAKGVWSPDDRMAWAWLVIPLLFGTGPEDAPTVSPWGWSDPRRVANENLHPARFSDAVIADEIRDKGPQGFKAQYNQNPGAYDDGMIKRSYVKYFRIADQELTRKLRLPGTGLGQDGEPEPAFVLGFDKEGNLDLDWLVVTVDASNGSEQLTASQVGILVVGGKGALRFVFDDRTAIMGIEAMYDEVARAVADYPVDKVLVELKAAGSSVVNDLRKRMREQKLKDKDGNPKVVKIEEIKVAPNDSKESRAAAMVSSWSNGFVFVLDGALWLYPKVISGGRVVDEGFVAEICGFPKSKKNDRVDALSQVMAFFSLKGDVKSQWKALARA